MAAIPKCKVYIKLMYKKKSKIKIQKIKIRRIFSKIMTL